MGLGSEHLVIELSRLLRANGQRLATVESCTGGLVGAAMTDLAGASDVFVGGLITYSNEAKRTLAGVKAETLDEHGAVSAQVAIEMAQGGRERLGSDIAVSITGIAGPGGGSEDKPVGTVWICVDSERRRDCRRFVIRGDRDVVRGMSVFTALRMLILGPRPIESECERFEG